MPPTQKVFSTGSELPPLAPGTLRLYSNRVCPYAQRARIVLALKNIEYETVNTHLRQKPEWITDLNPMGTVPVLQKDDTVVYESVVICEYLDEVYPGEKIVPADPYQKAKDKMFLERYYKVITNYYGVLRALATGGNSPEESVKAVVSAYDVIEGELKKRQTKFFGGEKPMLIDFVMWPHLERITALATKFPHLAVNGDTTPLFKEWIENITSYPAVKATVRSPEFHLGFFKTMKEGSPNYDYGLEEE